MGGYSLRQRYFQMAIDFFSKVLDFQPDDIQVLDVEYPGEEIISEGRADIHFYKRGYSDKAMIHVENNDNEQLSFLIEPFLSKVKVYEKYEGFEN